MKTLQLNYFASVREALGCEAENWNSEAHSVAGLRQELAQRSAVYADIFSAQRRVCVALNQRLVRDDAPLHHGDEVAFFPPVTGG